MLAFLFRHLFTIINIIIAVERVVSEDTTGAEKKQYALRAIVDTLKSFGIAVTEQIEAAIGLLIDAFVSLFNTSGTFAHRKTAEVRATERAIDQVTKPRSPDPAVQRAMTEELSRLDGLETDEQRRAYIELFVRERRG